MTLEDTLQALYDSEIHAGVIWLWDGGFTALVGASSSAGPGWEDAVGTVRTLAEVAPLLAQAARRLYPGSRFARALTRGDACP